MQLLRGTGHIPDGVRVPSLDTVFHRGEVGGGIEEASVALANEAGFFGEGRDIREKNTNSPLADLRRSSGEKFSDQSSKCRIVEAFPQAFIETDPEFFVDLFEFGPG